MSILEITHPVTTVEEATNNDKLFEEALQENNIEKIKTWTEKYGSIFDMTYEDGFCISSNPKVSPFFRFQRPSYDVIVSPVCEREYLDLLKYLVSIGAHIENHADDVRYPVEWAAYGGHMEVLQYLLYKGVEKKAALAAAACRNHM